MTDPSTGLQGGAGFRGQQAQDWVFDSKVTAAPALPGDPVFLIVPVAEIWSITFISLTCTTTAAAGNRAIQLIHYAAAGFICEAVGSALSQGPSTTWQFLYGNGVNAQAYNVTQPIVQTPLPDRFTLSGGDKLQASVIGPPPGDVLSAMTVTYRKYSSRVGI